MANVCIQMCESMYQLPSRICCFLLVLIQGGILDYYLVSHKNLYWYGWIGADVAIGFVLFVAFMISYRHLRYIRKSSTNNRPIQAGSLPLAYFAWFIYSLALAGRVGIIFNDFAWELKEENVFGPNTLKITISLAAIVFLLLLMSHHDAELNSERRHYIEEMTATVVFDILDSVDALDIMFEKEDIDDLPNGMGMCIITISCLNLILPVLPLCTLSRTHFGHHIQQDSIILLHKLSLVFVVNLPLLVFRLVLWHALSKEISIFPVKNVIVIFLVFQDLYERNRQKLRARDETDSTASHHEMKQFPIQS